MGLSFRNRLKQFFTTIFLQGMRLLAKFCFFLPIKNRIVFCSYSGRQYACNPMYLYQWLAKEKPDEFECIWVFKKKDAIRSFQANGGKAVRFFSFRHIIAELTACISVNNSICYFPARKGQIKLNTWHGGGCYKRIGYGERMAGKNLVNSARNATHFISSSKYFTDHVVRASLGFHGIVLETGMPRNDIFWTDAGEARKKVKLWCGEDDFWILYAPTWRYGEPVAEPDFEKICEAVQDRFGRTATVLCRTHYLYDPACEIKNVINVSEYPDMQELLCACDLLLTDYSSCIWDYSFTYKPCFLFAPDAERYEKERGFCEDINTWGFPVCRDNQELCNAIRNFSQDGFEQNMKRHHRTLRSFENGTASKKIWETVLKETQKNPNGRRRII